MGVDYSIYIGPFVKCQSHKVMAMRDIVGCGNGDCREFQKQIYDRGKNFCSECGSPLEKQQLEYETDNVDAFKFQEEKLNCSLFESSGSMFARDDNLEELPKGTHVYLPNNRRDGYKTFGGDPKRDTIYTEIQSLNVQTEIEGFKRAYDDEINLLKQVYGEENVEITWGFFNSAS